MTNNNTLKEKINDYGNNIVAISLDFLKHKSTEEQRNEDYKLAGEILVKDIETLIQQAKEEEMNRIEDKFIKYVNWNWHASLGYGEDLKIFEKALEEYSWLELDKESILNKLSNTK